jgi:acetolactate decarboxylase
MPKIIADIPASLNSVLHEEIARTKTDASSIVTAALAQYLKTPVHTLFQVSTSGALVAGVYSGAVNVQSLLQHGDFGLGTYANLDGEMVVLDGHVYQVRGTGRVSEAPPTAQAPFAVVTRFSPETDLQIGSIANLNELQERCDALRTSGNISIGRFRQIRISTDAETCFQKSMSGPADRGTVL